MYFSTPFWFDGTRPIRQRILQQYYGSDAEEVWGVSVQNWLDEDRADRLQPLSPLGLFEHLPDDSPLL
jgi:prenylcysteine alpha-carboxyl methylesterase